MADIYTVTFERGTGDAESAKEAGRTGEEQLSAELQEANDADILNGFFIVKKGDGVAAIKDWSAFFMERAGTWEGELGMNLAYLFAGMATGTGVSWHESEPAMRILRRCEVPADASIWAFIEIEKDDGDEIVAEGDPA